MSWLSNLLGEKGTTTQKYLTYEQVVSLFENLKEDLDIGKSDLIEGIDVLVYDGRSRFSSKTPSDVLSFIKKQGDKGHYHGGLSKEILYVIKAKDKVNCAGNEEKHKLDIYEIKLKASIGNEERWVYNTPLADITYKICSKEAKREVELEN